MVRVIKEIRLGVVVVTGKGINVPEGVHDSRILVIWAERKPDCLEHGKREGSQQNLKRCATRSRRFFIKVTITVWDLLETVKCFQ